MWPNPQFPEDLVTFTGEILNGKVHFLCSEIVSVVKKNYAGSTWNESFRQFFLSANQLPYIVAHVICIKLRNNYMFFNATKVSCLFC